MKVEELHKFIDQRGKMGDYPSSAAWPESLTIPSDVWQKLSDIQRYTSKDGHEYALNLFYIDGEIIVTPYTRGTERNVTPRDTVRIKYESGDGVKVTKKIFVNSTQVKSSYLKRNDIPDKTKITHIFNVHTHPTQSEKYSFFSPVDIRSFLASNIMAMGLITDRFWLICKTKDSIKVLGENGETQISYISNQIFSGREDIDKLIKENLSNWRVVFYEGKIGSILGKIK